jgi:tetratricopeptide (TPR) repeat protein
MAFHPRWQLRTPGQLWLAAPGFMLVVPEGHDVELVYGTTWIGRAGEAASLIALLAVMATFVLGSSRDRCALLKPQPAEAAPVSGPQHRSVINAWMGAGALTIVGATLAVSSPGIAYFDAWEAYRAGRYEQASRLFAKAHHGRRSPAGQEEALFWAAKAAEASGNTELALARFTHLVGAYHGYWLQESLRQVAKLSAEAGDDAGAQAARQRLRTEFSSEH